MLALVPALILVLAGCLTAPEGGGQDSALTYIKYARPEDQDWGDKLVTSYFLNPKYKDEIITLFSNENRLIIRTYTRDWNLGQTVFEYVELRELKRGTDFCPKFIRYSASDSNIVTEYMAFDEPKIGDTIVMPWDEGDMTIEFLGQTSPSSSLVFNESPRFGRWMYPGYYRLSTAGAPGYRYLHISGGAEPAAVFTGWNQP